MAATAGIFNHQQSAQALSARTATPMTAPGSSTSGTSSSSSSSATISANDFLTLLVTEMKNQDPTADTDPNEYINQLVNVNSLEQLISINQTLSTDLTPPAEASSGGTPAPGVTGPGVTGATKNPNSADSHAANVQTQPSATEPSTGISGAIGEAAAKLAPGNLSVPPANPAASRVAQSLSGRPRMQ